MSVMGNCIKCGARCSTAPGAGARNERASHVAALASSDRTLGYEIESVERWSKRDVSRLICRDCLASAITEALR